MSQPIHDMTMMISIHTSAREATKAAAPYKTVVHISIHASAREATDFSKAMHLPEQFQSTPPRGRRRFMVFDNLQEFTISIHASAREATGN